MPSHRHEALGESAPHRPPYEYQSDFARRYFLWGKVDGRAESLARAVLAMLTARGVAVPEEARVRIAECRDRAQLEVWVRRAATATTVDDLFD